MKSIVLWARKITQNRIFELSITLVILINSILIGVETYVNNIAIQSVQGFILLIFTVEIVIRFIASASIRRFFVDPWNIFDLLLVIIGYLPETMIANGAAMLSLRVLRVFRVLRLLRAAKEIKLIVSVLMRSMSAMFYNVILFIIFIYLFAIIGVGIFQIPDPSEMQSEQLANYQAYIESISDVPSYSPDPFGTLGESMFTLFRELTGDAWTELRYTQLKACEYGLLNVNSTVVTFYHIIWVILSAFLLLNLVTGAILNNYQLAIDEQKDKEHHEKGKECK